MKTTRFTTTQIRRLYEHCHQTGDDSILLMMPVAESALQSPYKEYYFMRYITKRIPELEPVLLKNGFASRYVYNILNVPRPTAVDMRKAKRNGQSVPKTSKRWRHTKGLTKFRRQFAGSYLEELIEAND